MKIIPAHYYFERLGVSNIIRISSKWSEESTGYQSEHIYEQIACIDEGKYLCINAHLKQKTMGGEDFEIYDKKEITKEDYDSFCKKSNGIIDNDEYRSIFNETILIRQQIENAYPTCPKCNAVMTERSGRYGSFWGCRGYPKCDGTKKDPKASEKIKKLWIELSILNQKLSNLEKG